MSQQSSDSFRNPLKYGGQDYAFSPYYVRSRDPTTADIKPKENVGYYPLTSFWINSTNGNIWVLVAITSNLAQWKMFGNGTTGPIVGFSLPDSSTVYPNSSGIVTVTQGGGTTITGIPSMNTINITSSGSGGSQTNLTPDTGTSPVTPNGSNAIAVKGGTIQNAGTATNGLQTNGVSANELDIQLQYAGSHAGSSTSGQYGIAQFDSNSFTVTSGYVQLKGASPTLPAIQTLTGTSGGVIGPDSNGNVNLTASLVAAASTPAAFVGSGHTEQLQIQAASQQASSSSGNAGLASFNSAQFSVNSSTGFTSLVGSTTTPPTMSFPVPNGTSPVVPSATGAVTLTSSDSSVTITGSTNTINFQAVSGATTTKLQGDDSVTISPSGGIIMLQGNTITPNGSKSKPVYVSGSGSTETINVQVTAASASSGINNAGLASFNSSQFTVDSNGYVSITTPSTNPLGTVTMYDDFIGASYIKITTEVSTNYNALVGTYTWVQSNGTVANVLDNGHPGIVAGGYLMLGGTFASSGINFKQIILGGGVTTIYWVAKLSALSSSNNMSATFGLVDSDVGSGFSNGVYFSYTDTVNSGKWVLNAKNGGTTTSINSTSTADTSWHEYRIVINAGGTSAQFFIDGTSVGTVGTNIPTTGLTATGGIIQTGGQICYLDLYYLTIALTTSR